MQSEVVLTGTGGVRYPGVLTVPDPDPGRAAPDADAPDADVPDADVPGADTPSADVTAADLPDAGARASGATPVRRPALVMIYEVAGMTEEMRRVARDLAAEGFVVLIPDLFARGGPVALCVARALRTAQRGEGRELHDIELARRWLATRPEVDPERIGVIGFCMGGSFALLLARTGLYKVSAPFYGSIPVELTRSCPVVASFGARDRTTRGKPAALAGRLTALGVPHDVVEYPDAGHSFFTRTEGLAGRLAPHTPLRAEYHEASAVDAHRRIVSFFREHL